MVEIPTRDPHLLNEKPPDIVIDGLLVSLSPPVGIADQVFDGFGLFPVLVQLQHPALQQNADGRGALVKKKGFFKSSGCPDSDSSGFRIRIDLMRIRIRIWIQHFF
jgi:hypothetical protein